MASSKLAALLLLAVHACSAGRPRPEAPVPPRRIGILNVAFNAEVSLRAGSPRREALVAALDDRGWRDGANLVLVERFDDGTRPAQLPDILERAARELIDGKVELILAAGSTEALAAERVTKAVPIVFWSAEPIAEGLVTRLDQPGGNATGIIPRDDQYETRLRLIDTLVPGSGPVGFLFNPTYGPGVGTLERTRQSAAALSIRLDVLDVRDADALEPSIARLARGGARAVLVGNHGLFRRESRRIVDLALQRRLPVASPYPEARDAGALLTFVPDFEFWSRRAADYVDRILRGANAGELSVERSVPGRFTLNLLAAEKLGITVPEEVVRKVDRVIR